METGNKFWLLTALNARPLAQWDETMDLEQVICPAFPEHMRPGKRLTDLHVVLRTGKVTDFAETSYSEWLIQDNVLDALRSANLTGFEVRPVSPRFKKSKEPPPVLWELAVTGWAGLARPESGVHLNKDRSCEVCGYTVYTGFSRPTELIDENKWDGSDFFMVWPLPRFIFLSEKAFQFLLEKRFTGFNLTPVEQLEPTDQFIPGRLSYVMSEARAHDLGDELGIY